MRRSLGWVYAAILVTFGCSSPLPPVSPTAPTLDANAPHSLTLGMIVGLGADAGRADITARVHGVSGAPLANVTIAFATDAGTLSADRVNSDVNGFATTTLISSTSAHLTATAGSLTSRLVVPAQPESPLPPPSGPGVPPTTPDPGSLSVSLDPLSALTGANVIFTARVRNATAPSTHVWSFGDGTSSQGLSPSTTHAYTAAGTYTVTVTVTDAAGRSAQASTTATITDAPPPPAPPAPTPSYTVTLTALPASIVVGDSATLTASVTQVNGAPTPTSYQWDCTGDGTVDQTTSANTATCVYTASGTITAKVTVSSAAASGSGSTTVTVAAAAPLFVSISPSVPAPTTGTAIAFTATVTSTATVPASLQWQWDESNDGTYESISVGPNPNTRSVTYFSSGKKTIKVRVVDPATGREATSTLEVTVS